MENLEEEMKKYLETLSETELKAYEIAKDHLGMSFQLEKSLGFLDWLKKEKENQYYYLFLHPDVVIKC